MKAPVDEWDSGVALAQRRAKLEEAVINLLLRYRREGLPLVRAAGVTAAHFDHDDLRAIFIAIEWAEHRPLLDMLKACRRVLVEIGRLDETLASGTETGATWSSERLVNAATTPGDFKPHLLRSILTALVRCNAAYGREAAA